MPTGNDFRRAIQESDLSNRGGNIDSRNYLLIHGTADTLVHQQHSLVLTKALTDQAIGFRHQVSSFLLCMLFFLSNSDHLKKSSTIIK